MIPMPTAGSAELMRAAAIFNTKVAAGITKPSSMKDEQVQIATTPKDEVFHSDKVALYRYRLASARSRPGPDRLQPDWPLHDDRSAGGPLADQNLLQQGLDVWVVDWGSASRADRYLTIDDYVLHYLDDCVAAMRRETGAEAVNLLGICEAHVHAGIRRARTDAGEEPRVTVTPLDFHADQARRSSSMASSMFGPVASRHGMSTR